MKTERPFKTEAELCDAYGEFARAAGWIVYAETAGFDMVLARPEGDPHAGTQIGVEAKLKLNAKVVDQIMETTPYSTEWERGPDYRLVLVGDVGGAIGLVRMLSRLGVTTIAPVPTDSVGRPCTRIWPESRSEAANWYIVGSHDETPWTDLTPAHRCKLPEFIPNVRAGVPSPIQLSAWKVGALRVIAKLEVQGHVTRPEIKTFGCDPSIWTRDPSRWLEPIGNGRYVRSERLPAFEKQHPDIYATVLAEIQAKHDQVIKS